jgi:hypothetical protein
VSLPNQIAAQAASDVGGSGALVCRECSARVVAGTRIRDPQLTLLAGHLRIAHPGALHNDLAPPSIAILAHFSQAGS